MSSTPNTPASSSRPRSAKKTPASSRASSKGSKRSKSSKKKKEKRSKKDKKKQKVEIDSGIRDGPGENEPLQSVKYDLNMKPSDPKMASDASPGKPAENKPPSDPKTEPVRSDPTLNASDIRLKPSDPKPAMSDPKLKQQPGSGTDTDTSQPTRDQKRHRKKATSGFNVLFFMAQTLGLSIIVLTVAWIHSYAGGFSMKGPKNLKSWHPFLMTVGPVYLLANSLLTYQLILKKNKPNLKKAHMLINSLTLMCIVASQITLAMHSCEKLQTLKKDSYEPFYSLHAWIGVLAIVAFFVQYVLEAIIFLFPNKKTIAKIRMAKTNVILGLSTLFVSVVASVSGYLQQLMDHQISWSSRIFPGTDRARNEEIVVNTIGLLTVIFIGIISYLVFEQMINKKSSPSRSASRDRVNNMNRNEPRMWRDASQPTAAGGPSQPKRY